MAVDKNKFKFTKNNKKGTKMEDKCYLNYRDIAFESFYVRTTHDVMDYI